MISYKCIIKIKNDYNLMENMERFFTKACYTAFFSANPLKLYDIQLF